jgi:hypothetical protein
MYGSLTNLSMLRNDLFITHERDRRVIRNVALACLLLLSALSNTAKSQSDSGGPDRYYFDITRPDCCRLSVKDWQRIGKSLRAKGIPTFFGLYDVLNHKEAWHPVKLRRTQPDAGWLILGPFDSETQARNVLSRLPKLLPNRMTGQDERTNGVQPDPFGYKQHWAIGMYQISGFKSNLSIGTNKAVALKPETLTPGLFKGYGWTKQGHVTMPWQMFDSETSQLMNADQK